MDVLTAMKENFKDCFGDAETREYFSPGRINLIGEHTDYNGGHVFPCAISLGTYALVADRNDNKTRIFSMNLADKGVIEFPMNDLKYNPAYDWANYPSGVVDVFEKAGYKADHGFDIVMYGTLPNGAGLSSSASIEVLMAVILNDTFNFGIDMVDMVKFSQKAENQFVGVNCGIMDQFAVGMGKKDCAILLDCNTLEYRYSKLAMEGYSIVITNTNKKHTLSSSAYNQRRKQCEHALSELQAVKKDIKTLGDLTNAEFDSIADHIEDPLERLRAKHAVYENQRTLQAVDALEKNDLAKFGKLMNDSHVSLRDDYDVTGEELDTLAELAWDQEGVLGSRMTGAGFGGCTISIVKNENIEDFKKNVGEAYTKRIGYAPSFYVANIADGTHKIEG
ncbi:MAG: galactokinase [Selenomonadaceae bacterium]|nr:galactokinase [Selenomonadaceae bacterium]